MKNKNTFKFKEQIDIPQIKATIEEEASESQASILEHQKIKHKMPTFSPTVIHKMPTFSPTVLNKMPQIVSTDTSSDFDEKITCYNNEDLLAMQKILFDFDENIVFADEPDLLVIKNMLDEADDKMEDFSFDLTKRFNND